MGQQPLSVTSRTLPLIISLVKSPNTSKSRSRRNQKIQKESPYRCMLLSEIRNHQRVFWSSWTYLTSSSRFKSWPPVCRCLRRQRIYYPEKPYACLNSRPNTRAPKLRKITSKWWKEWQQISCPPRRCSIKKGIFFGACISPGNTRCANLFSRYMRWLITSKIYRLLERIKDYQKTRYWNL